jgi:hypothetical protein
MPVATTLGYFIGDSQLKKRIGDHVGLKSCPKAVTRSDLLDAAVRLRLIGETDVAVKAPKKDGRRPRTWSQHVAATVRRPVPLSSDPVRYFTDAELKAAIEQQVGGGQVAPDRLSRATMVTEALTMGIITQRQADLPSPCQLTEDELVQLWKGHVEAQSDGAKKSKRPSGRGKLTEALLGLGLISTAQAEATRKRPDRAAAAQLSKDSHQSTRCASLSSMLRGLPNAAAMAANMRAASDDASRLFHQRSFLLWLHLHRLARNGGDLPDMKNGKLAVFVRRVYTIGTQNSHIDDPALHATLRTYSSMFPPLKRPDHTNLITHASNVYAGAICRHFCNIDIVRQRIRRFAAARLLDYIVRPDAGEEDAETDAMLSQMKDRPDVGDAPLYNIVGALEDPKFRVDAMHPAQRSMVADIRSLLGLPVGTALNARWLRRNIHGSIRFCLHVVDTLDALRTEVEHVHLLFEKTIAVEADRPKLHHGAGRGGVFVPMNALKRRFVMLDATDLSTVLGAGENVDGSLRADFVRGMLSANIGRIFGEDYAPKKDGTPSTWLFTGTCDTDGDEIKMHFQRPLRPSERKHNKEFINEDESAASPAPAGDDEPDEPDTVVDTAPERLAQPPRLLLLVDPGRVNLATITVMLDGKIVTQPSAMGRSLLRPLKFTFSCRQYYTLIGERRRAAVQKQRERTSDAREKRDGTGGQKALRTRLSATTLRTGRVDRVLDYMRANLELPEASEQVWGRALGKATSACRRRRQMAKDACILRWFCGVRRRVKAVTGLTDATVVWGVKIAPTGRGNLSAPTDRVALLAARVEGWTVVAGDEYRTSKASCVPPHVDNLSPRFRGQTVIRYKRRPKSFRAKVRGGFVLGLDAKRMVRRGEYSEKQMRSIGRLNKRPEKRTKWTYDGHSGETADVKAAKKKEREDADYRCKYVRGLRVYIKDCTTTKFIDRDACGSLNIGIIWLSDNVVLLVRPAAFVRPKKGRAKLAKVSGTSANGPNLLPAQNSR